MAKHRQRTPHEPSTRLIGSQTGRISEAEYIALKLQALKARRPKDEAKPVTIRKFSWEE